MTSWILNIDMGTDRAQFWFLQGKMWWVLLWSLGANWWLGIQCALSSRDFSIHLIGWIFLYTVWSWKASHLYECFHEASYYWIEKMPCFSMSSWMASHLYMFFHDALKYPTERMPCHNVSSRMASHQYESFHDDSYCLTEKMSCHKGHSWMASHL